MGRKSEIFLLSSHSCPAIPKNDKSNSKQNFITKIPNEIEAQQMDFNPLVSIDYGNLLKSQGKLKNNWIILIY